MKIQPMYTLQIDDDTYINCESQIKMVCEDEFDEMSGDIFDGRITGIFKSCDDEGLWIETGIDQSNMLYILFDEIKEIEVI